MTQQEQEDKNLLFRDLSARLPFHVRCKIWLKDGTTEEGLLDLEHNYGNVLQDAFYYNKIKDIKPYLRPLSSMTEEEKKDILQLLNIHGDIDNEGNLLLGVECNIVILKVCKKYLGELNKRMFDVCHMIEKGLALEAPEGMYILNK